MLTYCDPPGGLCWALGIRPESRYKTAMAKPTIDIRRPHSFDKETARAKAESLADGMKEKLGLVWAWKGDAIEFNAPSGMAKGTKGAVAVSDKEVHVTVFMPLLLRAAKGTVERKITEKLDKILS